MQSLEEFNIPLVEECAPTIQPSNQVCSSKEMLRKLKDWLKVESEDPKRIIEAAKAKTNCDSESCALEKAPNVSQDEIEQRFKPKGPWNSVAWLSNSHIDNVLAMWAKKFPHFCHIPFQMRDFANSQNPLSEFDWAEAPKHWRQVACVLNTDWSSGSGIHWVAFYVDLEGKTVEFFNSAGDPPEPEFTQLMVKAAKELKGFTDVAVCSVEHQTENFDCGVYSIFYILSRLHGIPYRRFLNKRIPDSVMQTFRRYLFRHS